MTLSIRSVSFAILSGLLLFACSCRSADRAGKFDLSMVSDSGPSSLAFAGLPREAYTGHPGDGYTIPGLVAPHMEAAIAGVAEVSDSEGPYQPPLRLESESSGQIQAVEPNAVQTLPPKYNGPPPMPVMYAAPWQPPGIGGSWPEDEYIFDGGDHNGGVQVRDDWSLVGLDEEDTIIHYDTLDGRTVVKPSNRVCIYAPRFAAVRQVTLPYGDNQFVRAGGVDAPIGPEREDILQPVSTTLQPVQPVAEVGDRSTVTFLEKQPPIGLIANLVVRATVDRLKPYEDFDLIRFGKIEEGEKPFIAQAVQAAITWTLDQGVQVAVDGKRANIFQGDRRAQATYFVQPGKPCLRICKIASTHSALPGEIVEFTIRFDNVGEQTIGNVTLVDDLTARLEYLESSAQASVDAEFFTDPNPQGSLVLRWEIKQPMKAGEGGIARFKCRVR
ncbi:MAG: DUF11 domain-containing protein [Pirellulales bacterium]|nr:DUF11 domain-containing protein [Pirellulales bacterium]